MLLWLKGVKVLQVLLVILKYNNITMGYLIFVICCHNVYTVEGNSGWFNTRLQTMLQICSHLNCPVD